MLFRSENMTDGLESGIFADASGNLPTDNNNKALFTVDPANGIPLTGIIANQVSLPGIKTAAQLQPAWDQGMGAKLGALQDTENLLAIMQNGVFYKRADQLTAA